MNTNDLKFFESELLSVAPFPVNDCGQFKMKIVSERGRTKWMNITPEQFHEIENVLYGIPPGTKLFGKKLEN